MKPLSFRYFLAFLGLFLAYSASVCISLHLDAANRFATLVWPPAGIALALVLLFGFWFWPIVFVSALVVNLWMGLGWVGSLGTGIGNSLECVFAYWLMRDVFKVQLELNRVRDIAGLFLTSIFSPSIAAFFGAICLRFGLYPAYDSLMTTWIGWWMGDAIGLLIVTPVVLLWMRPANWNVFKRRLLEAVGLSVLLTLVSRPLFTSIDPTLMPAPIFPYLIFPFVIWAALRFEQIGCVTVNFLLSSAAVWGAIQATGPFVHMPTLRDNLYLLVTFMGILAMTGMVLAASVLESKNAKSALKDALRIRDDFLSIASHELKTPITALNFQIYMGKKTALEGGRDDGALERMFDRFNKQVGRLKILTEDLLDASRIRSGRFNLNIGEENISELLRECVSRNSDQLQKHGCELLTDFQNEMTAWVDKSRIEQVMDNLFSNVVKYAPGGPVRISLRQAGARAVIMVEDEGPGIPESQLDKVFERFERATLSRSISGLGLGLYVVKEIVAGHGGWVRAENVVPKGCRLTVEIPLRSQAAEI